MKTLVNLFLHYIALMKFYAEQNGGSNFIGSEENETNYSFYRDKALTLYNNHLRKSEYSYLGNKF